MGDPRSLQWVAAPAVSGAGVKVTVSDVTIIVLISISKIHKEMVNYLSLSFTDHFNSCENK